MHAKHYTKHTASFAEGTDGARHCDNNFEASIRTSVDA